MRDEVERTDGCGELDMAFTSKIMVEIGFDES